MERVYDMSFEPKGIIAAMVTPFNEREELDEEAVREVIRHLLKGGVHGIFVSGSQGEFWALDEAEKKRLFEISVDEVNGKTAVYAGTGAESTGEAVRLTRIAKDAGVGAASIITPYYVKPNNEELISHYSTIAGKVDLPILLYNNPDRASGVCVDPEVLLKLAEEHSNIVGIKDSSGDLTLISEYIRKCGHEVSTLVGRDTLICAALSYGGQGAIAATANVVPALVVDIYESFVKGDYKRAMEAQYRLAPLRIAFELGSFPVVIKEALNIMGIKVGSCRKPVLPMDAESRESLRRILLDLELKLE